MKWRTIDTAKAKGKWESPSGEDQPDESRLRVRPCVDPGASPARGLGERPRPGDSRASTSPRSWPGQPVSRDWRGWRCDRALARRARTSERQGRRDRPGDGLPRAAGGSLPGPGSAAARHHRRGPADRLRPGSRAVAGRVASRQAPGAPADARRAATRWRAPRRGTRLRHHLRGRGAPRTPARHARGDGPSGTNVPGRLRIRSPSPRRRLRSRLPRRCPIVRGGTPPAAHFLRLTLDKLEPALLADRTVTAAEYAEAVAVLTDSSRTIVMPMTVAAWGWRKC